MASIAPYQYVSALAPKKSAHDLSYSKLYNCDAGQLVPVMCDLFVPGDVVSLSNEAVIRLQPMITPVMHNIKFEVQYFFSPLRLLWEDWEDFITGGPAGTDATALPRWQVLAAASAKYSLWDYLGFPTGMDHQVASDYAPVAFPLYCYNAIYNEWYRDQALIAELALDSAVPALYYRSWAKDYFTSALEWQQRGTAPALPVTIGGTANTNWAVGLWANADSGAGTYLGFSNAGVDNRGMVGGAQALANAKTWMNSGTVPGSSFTATTFDIADLRLAFQIQKWLERNARSGARYTEFLTSHFGIAPMDSRLQRPEWIGGTRQSVVISEVLQTSETDASPQGNLAGHGISAAGNSVGTFRVPEFGIIMAIASVMPEASYSQGINRQWLQQTKYDFYFPEFANLSEQEIVTGEIFYTGVEADDAEIFGYQGKYDEYRTKQNMFVADMRDGEPFDYWHWGRIFAVAPELNQSFIECNPDKRIFAVQTEPGFIVHFANQIRCLRPMPQSSEPGLIDHS